MRFFRLFVAVLFVVSMPNVLDSEVVAGETYAGFVQRVNTSPPQGIVVREDLESVLLTSANAYRKSKGGKSLGQAEELLVQAARAHAIDMVIGDFVGHRSTSGQNFESRMRSIHPGVIALPPMAENAARDRSGDKADAAKARKLFAQWVKSPPHSKTLRSRDYLRVATGVVQKGDKIYAVQIFVGPELKTNMFGGTKKVEADSIY